MYLQYVFESGLHVVKLITVKVQQDVFKYATRIGCVKYCCDKPRLITHTFNPHPCPYSVDLAIFSATFKRSYFFECSLVCMFVCVPKISSKAASGETTEEVCMS